MLGLPGETLQDALETIYLNIAIGTDYPWCSLYYPFPGTELAQIARDNGLFEPSEKLSEPSFFKKSFIKSKFNREFANLQKLFFYAVKFPLFIPVIKKLIRLKSNIFFDFAFLLGYAYCYIFSENKSLKEIFSIGFRNVITFFFSRSNY